MNPELCKNAVAELIKNRTPANTKHWYIFWDQKKLQIAPESPEKKEIRLLIILNDNDIYKGLTTKQWNKVGCGLAAIMQEERS